MINEPLIQKSIGSSGWTRFTNLTRLVIFGVSPAACHDKIHQKTSKKLFSLHQVSSNQKRGRCFSGCVRCLTILHHLVAVERLVDTFQANMVDTYLLITNWLKNQNIQMYKYLTYIFYASILYTSNDSIYDIEIYELHVGIFSSLPQSRKSPHDFVKKVLFSSSKSKVSFILWARVGSDKIDTIVLKVSWKVVKFRGSEDGTLWLVGCASGIRVSANFAGRRFCTAPNAMSERWWPMRVDRKQGRLVGDFNPSESTYSI